MCFDDDRTQAVATAPELVLIRGLPGSGKSTLAKVMTGHVHVEQDMYFTQSDGSYLYDETKMQAAINWCLFKTCNALQQHHNVVVSNTFTRSFEWKSYVAMAFNLRVKLRFVEAKAVFKSVHDVPDHRIARMRARWEELPAVFSKPTAF